MHYKCLVFGIIIEYCNSCDSEVIIAAFEAKKNVILCFVFYICMFDKTLFLKQFSK